MYSEEQLLQLSGLQHLLFCERQCALIHIEGIWIESRLTIEGKQLHDKVHSGESESRGNVKIVTGLMLQSLRLGLSGKADVVEFRKMDASKFWHPFPVEYKRGRPKRDKSDEVQLCAQAICLEEMLNIKIPMGALFYGKTRHRKEIIFDDQLRSLTESMAKRLHELIESGITPNAEYSKKCNNCSLFDVCMPKSTHGRKSVKRYLNNLYNPKE